LSRLFPNPVRPVKTTFHCTTATTNNQNQDRSYI
jgi:hypothetical protein